MLCKRLINQESANDSYEDTMIQKLKFHIGAASVTKLYTMKNDINISKSI